MTLKKNQAIKFSRPVSTMKTVYEAVEAGLLGRHEIVQETKLLPGQVRSALYNLAHVGAIRLELDGSGRKVYMLPRLGVSASLLGVSSIFNVRLTNNE